MQKDPASQDDLWGPSSFCVFGGSLTYGLDKIPEFRNDLGKVNGLIIQCQALEGRDITPTGLDVLLL